MRVGCRLRSTQSALALNLQADCSKFFTVVKMNAENFNKVRQYNNVIKFFFEA